MAEMAENGSENSDISQNSDPIKEEDSSGAQPEREELIAGEEEVLVEGEEVTAGGSDNFALPRRSSLMKDSAKKKPRKKTVSFTSFPEDRPISKGKKKSCLMLSISFSNLNKFNNTIHMHIDNLALKLGLDLDLCFCLASDYHYHEYWPEYFLLLPVSDI